MYKISVLAMFKNESWIIKEWIEHYLSEGIEHFYLIDNGSTDDYELKIKNYMNCITLVKDPTRKPSGTQSYLYKLHFLDKIKKETEWIIVCDIDEYIYARKEYKKIIDVLNVLPNNIDKLWIPWKIYGSNSYVEQPDCIVKSFIKRKYENIKMHCGFGKCIAKTKNLINFGCCGHNIQLSSNNEPYAPNCTQLPINPLTENIMEEFNLHLNHYMLMSEQYYREIKCKRGGGESGITFKYSLDCYHNDDKNYNTHEDIELLNKKISNKTNMTQQHLNLFFKHEDKKLFHKYVDKSKYYFEYGSGGSTYNASLKKNLINIISVESDKNWFDKVNEYINNNKEKIKIHYIEMDTQPNNFGYPGPKSTKENWIQYSNVIKKIDKNISSKLDIVLIDGRFRVACCLKCYSIINDNCLIIFDDFLNRKYYHIVLDYFDIIDKSSDECMVILKKKIDKNPPLDLIKKYELISQ
jgi:hypothetical protein